jgi:hypothetical protein
MRLLEFNLDAGGANPQSQTPPKAPVKPVARPVKLAKPPATPVRKAAPAAIEQRKAQTAPVKVPSGEERYRWIAHAAYLRAEKRGFEPGREVDDWLAAEAEFAAAFTTG